MIDPGLDEPSDLSYDVEDDGRLVRRQLDRKIWQRAGWAVVAIHYQELDPVTERWRAPRAVLVRLRKVRGRWRRHAVVPLAATAAIELAGALAGWFADGGDDGDDDAADDRDD